MRIIEKEEKIIAKQPKKEEKREKNQVPEKQDKGKGLGCLKTFGCLLFCFILVLLTVFCLVFFIAKPIVEKTNKIPTDFPQELVFHQIDSAKIRIQEQTNKLKAIKLIESLPNWLISPFINLLAANPIGQITLKQDKKDSEDAYLLKIENLEESLKESTEKEEKTVSVFWEMKNKEKEEIFEYYKNKLKLENYEVKENISDYDLNLTFLKDGISGIITIRDSFSKNNSSLIDMTVNYLSKQ